MDYLVRGWNKFNFLLSPSNLEEILSKYHLVIFNEHVPFDYTESSLKEYLSAYGTLYEMLISGKKIDIQKDYSLFLHRGITSNLENCVYGKLHEYEGKQYKLADFNEPVVGISPSSLWFTVDENKKLFCSSVYSYIVYSEYYMGAQLQFPKTIQYLVDGEYEPLKSTETLCSYRDYQALKNSIKEIARCLTIKSADGSVKRTDIMVDDETKSKLNNCYSFQQSGITVK